MLQTLTNALCNELGKEELQLHSKVLELSCSFGESSPLDNWSVSYEWDQRKHLDEKSFDAVIVTVSLCIWEVVIDNCFSLNKQKEWRG